MHEIRPQAGFQEKVLASQADILIIGGAAGCGKSYVKLLAAARHVQPHRGLNGKLYRAPAGFAAVFFRRTLKQAKMPGGLWDDSKTIYPFLGGRPHGGDLEWLWTSAKIKFAGLEHETSIFDWHGSQIPLLLFDELTLFSARMFWYMQSRNRSACGIRPYTIASCNPDADSWVAELIAWWIDQDPESPTYGLPIPEREGVLRYFTRVGDEMIWGYSREEICAKVSGLKPELVNSLTFIPGSLDENKALERKDPTYRAKLMAMTRVERARLLGGNWKVRSVAGTYFQKHEVTMLDQRPDLKQFVSLVRRWDLAATEPNEKYRDPDWTCGVLIGKTREKRFVILDVVFVRKRADEVRQTIKRTAIADTKRVRICIPQDPGQAGKEQFGSYVKFLVGWPVIKDIETGDKETRAQPFASQWQAGNVDVVRGAWNSEYFHQMEGFVTPGIHDDAVDASAGGFAKVNKAASMFDVG